jgi:hypothetical protein
MREQDLRILRQFMCIQQTVNMLCRDNILVQKTVDDSPDLLSPADQTSSDAVPIRSKPRTIHVPLCRVQSAPLEKLREDSLEESDPLLRSFDSFGETLN